MKFSIGKFFAWILVGLLLIGLLGFGITDVLVGRSNSNLATVGDSKITSRQRRRGGHDGRRRERRAGVKTRGYWRRHGYHRH